VLKSTFWPFAKYIEHVRNSSVGGDRRARLARGAMFLTLLTIDLGSGRQRLQSARLRSVGCNFDPSAPLKVRDERLQLPPHRVRVRLRNLEDANLQPVD
jgi:hypothetical protein